jgi:hypothetical protein
MKASIFFIAMAVGVGGNLPEWPQFGGPNRNFMIDSKGLADAWPAEGPKKLWMRPLGEGYSEISVDQGTLYTMYRKGEQEVAIAMDAATGKTRWEYAYNASFGNMAMENGPGPHTTPLILGNRVYTVGILAILNCFDKTTGKLVWSKDLYKDFPGASRIGPRLLVEPDGVQEQHHSDDWWGGSRGDRARSGRRAPIVGEERFRKFAELADAD